MSKFMTCVKLPIEPVNVGVGVYNNELLSKWEAKITGNIFRSLVQYVFLKKVLKVSCLDPTGGTWEFK